jgi:peroxiredoxin
MAPESRGAPFLTIAAAIACLLGTLFGAATQSHADAAATELQRWSGGDQPGFTLPDSAGGADVALQSVRGQIVLVHFFATWCEPCREELPALNRLLVRTGATVKVLAISVAEVDLRVRRFLETTPVNFPVLLDRDRAIAKAWKVSTLPTTFVLDAELRPRMVTESDFAWDGVDPETLTMLLTQKPAKTEDQTKLTHQGG